MGTSARVAAIATSGTISDYTEDTEWRHASGLFTALRFETEMRGVLSPVHIQFETWGRLNPSGTNAVVVCHALTGDAHAADSRSARGWWSGLIGPGRAIDTARFYVIATNVLGGCAGSSGPASAAHDGLPYATRFPVVSIRDMVKVQSMLLDALGVKSVFAVIGGSMGGMQAWEWQLTTGKPVQNTIAIAAQSAFSPLGMGYNHAMRQAILTDPDWQNGNYYGTGRCPLSGLSVARSIGMLTYRSGPLFDARFGRSVVAQSGGPGDAPPQRILSQPWFEVESYLKYQGEKLGQRFDANSYLYLTRAMDSHDIGRGRGGFEAALRKLDSALTVIGITQDYLYPPAELQSDADKAQAAGVITRYLEMRSDFGHDAFLADQSQLNELLQPLFQ